MWAYLVDDGNDADADANQIRHWVRRMYGFVVNHKWQLAMVVLAVLALPARWVVPGWSINQVHTSVCVTSCAGVWCVGCVAAVHSQKLASDTHTYAPIRQITFLPSLLVLPITVEQASDVNFWGGLIISLVLVAVGTWLLVSHKVGLDTRSCTVCLAPLIAC